MSFQGVSTVATFHIKRKASVPIGYSAHRAESYVNMKEMNNWLICGDLKVIAILLGMQGGYTNYPCFLCLWDSRADDLHFQEKNWPKCDELIPGLFNITSHPLVSPQKIIFPPLHIKLGIMKSFGQKLHFLNSHSSFFPY